MGGQSHTPGPWEVVPHSGKTGRHDPNGTALWVYPVDGQGMGWAGESYLGVFVGTVEDASGAAANARLIAAAPELLEALVSICGGHDASLYPAKYANARAAIAKATGESA